MEDRTHVPDKLEAYLLQVRHALFELLSYDNRIVSVEAIDDVAVETDSEIIAEQTKNVLSSNNPLNNKAVAFWKTLYNWCQYYKTGQFGSKSMILKYLIVASHHLSMGSIAKSFSNSSDEIQAHKALEDARSLLFEMNNSEPNVSDECKPYVKYCFAADNEEVIIKIIINLMIEVHEDAYDTELKKKFVMQPIPHEYDDEIFFTMLGWVQERIHQFTKKNRPAYISSDEYRKELDKEICGRDRKIILNAISVKPSNEETDLEVNRHDTYVKQLELISLDISEIYMAASDFLRTKSDIVSWAKKGLVTDLSFEDYDEKLKKLWNIEKRICDGENSFDDIKRGQRLYYKCQEKVFTLNLQGRDVPNFFGSGRLQFLANEPSDKPEIGWHPDYVKLLNLKEKDE